MSDTPLLRVAGVDRWFGGNHAVANVSFSLAAGSVTALVGGNGCGKTTLFNLISGFVRPDAGSIYLQEQQVNGWPAHRVAAAGVARLFQDVRLYPQESTLDNLLLGAPLPRGENAMDSWFAGTSWRAAEEEQRQRAAGVLAELGLAEYGPTPAGTLSFGQQKLLAFGRCRMAEYRVLLLDEPAAGVAASTRQLLAEQIRGSAAGGGAVLFIEHNLQFAFAVADHVMVMHNGELALSGPPAAVRGDARFQKLLRGEEP